MLFISDSDGRGDRAWSMPADGGPASLVTAEERQIFETEWSRDGHWLIYRTDDDQPRAGRGDILALRTAAGATPIALVATGAEETGPAVSWDSRWLAYASDESGRKEVFVRPFPNTAAGKWQVSTDGGTEPVWARSGQELFYRDAAGNMVVAAVAARDSSFEVLGRRVLFNARLYLDDQDHRFYQVSPDGERFIMIGHERSGAAGDLIMLSNFHRLLRESGR